MSTEEQKQRLDSWFAEYDGLSMKGDVEGMADMAMFPVHVVTESSDGNGYTENWTRDRFVQTMTEAMKATLDDVFERVYPNRVKTFTRQAILLRVLGHDFHHGGEISTILGMHGLAGLDE